MAKHSIYIKSDIPLEQRIKLCRSFLPKITGYTCSEDANAFGHIVFTLSPQSSAADKDNSPTISVHMGNYIDIVAKKHGQSDIDIKDCETCAYMVKEFIESNLIKETERLNNKETQKFLAQSFAELKANGCDGYWEYRVISLIDENGGGIPPQKLQDELTALGLSGWHLRCAYANELGRNSSSGGYGGISMGSNSTVDQHVLIFERFKKLPEDSSGYDPNVFL